MQGSESATAPPFDQPNGAQTLLAAEEPSSPRVEEAGEVIETYRVRDPQAPDRELLVEFVPASLAQLTDVADEGTSDGGHAAHNAFDAVVDSIPAAGALLAAGKTMRVVGPPEALAGLANHTYELVTSGGKTLGLARDVSSGQLAAHLRFAKAGVTPAVGALGVFKVMSVVTGQYYLHRIDTKLSTIQAGVDRIVRGQHSEAFGKIAAAARLNERVRKNLLTGIPPNVDDRPTLDRAEQLVLPAYDEVKHNLSPFLAKFETVPPSATKDYLRSMWQEASGDVLTNANLLVYAALIRHQSNLLTLAIDPQGDPRRARNIKERADQERQEMVDDIETLWPVYARLTYSKERLENRFTFGVPRLEREAKQFADLWKPLRSLVDQPGETALPRVPEIDLPFVAEISVGSDGGLRTAGAVLRAASKGTAAGPSVRSGAGGNETAFARMDLLELERLRADYRPERVEVLLIGESPPDPGEGELRFFYAPELRADNLYRGVVEAVYGLELDGVKATPKTEMLGRLRNDGFWLIDAVEEPINKRTPRERSEAIREGVPDLVRRCKAIAPRRGVVICHGEVYKLTADALRAAGVRVLHDEPLPFPLGNWRGRFVRGLRESLDAT
jgi:hypothetical protein